MDERMSYTLICVLGLFLLNTPYGHSEATKPKATLTADTTIIPVGGEVTLTCSVDDSADWKYYWYRQTSEYYGGERIRNVNSNRLTVYQGGIYYCRGGRGQQGFYSEFSNRITIQRTVTEPKATLTAHTTIIPVGGRVTLTCYVDNSADWKYDWFRRTSSSSTAQSINVGVSNSISEGGIYNCRGGRGQLITEDSNPVTIYRRVSNKPVVTLQPNWPLIYRGETITVRCEIQGGAATRWEYEWRVNNMDRSHKDKEYMISSASVSNSGDYSCMGRKDSFSFTEWSDAFRVTVSQNKPKATLRADTTIIPVGGEVTLTCSVDDSADWKYYWYNQTSEYSGGERNSNRLTVYQGGIYDCRGGRGQQVFYSEFSNRITIQRTVSNKPVVTLQPNWPLIYRGETITVRCEIQGGAATRWEYEWRVNNMEISHKDKEYMISSASVSNSGDYSCMGRKDSFSSTEWSDAIRVTVSPTKPKATLTADTTIIPEGGEVTLTCSVDDSANWKYYWYNQTSEYSVGEQISNVNSKRLTVYQGGVYDCRGGRGQQGFYTVNSDKVTIHRTVSNKPVVTLQPNWPLIYRGETITVRCEIQGGGATEWRYEWTPATLNTSPTLSRNSTSSTTVYSSEYYRCKGWKDSFSSTEWSDAIRVTVSQPPEPVLTVSPSWLSPGDSVTLSCEVEHPSAGWRFYWYKTVPKPPDNSHINELLPGSTSGTEQDSYIVHGPTHTAGYVCRAGRGDPVFYTKYSKPKIVWSGDVHSAVTLTVSPDRLQHFTSDSVSLSCEGNSTEWRVRRSDGVYLRYCDYLMRNTRYTCDITSSRQSDAVYWCESGSGEFSNAVNITQQNADIILVSPVHPVTEGHSVTLGCKLRGGEFLSNVLFYQNDKLIQNDTRGKMNISAVSKTDEGFYKCKYSGKQSPQSWLSVMVSRPDSSSSPLLVIVGLVCGFALVILLLLLCRYRRSKDSLSIRPIQPESTNQNEAQVTSSPHVEEESQHITYSSLELKNIPKTERRNEPVESSVYSDVKIQSAEDANLMYVQVNHHSKGKAKKHKRKSPPATTEETVYSEIKLGTDLGL